MAQFTFIFDIGKTNIKGYVINDQAQIVWSKGTQNITAQDGNYPHFDVQGIEQWLNSAISEANQQFPIEAINTSTHGACAVLLNADGQLALPVIDYEYEDIAQDDAEYLAIRPAFSESQSPNLSAGLNLGRQLWWLRKHFPSAFTETCHVLMYPQYWVWRMTGIMINERTSLGCHTDLWSPTADNYSSLVEHLGLSNAIPPLVKAYECVGTVSADFARSTGLNLNCKVYAGVHDSNASFARYLGPMGSAAFTVVSTGTWIITMSSAGDASTLKESADMLANISVNGTPIPCARFMGGREFETLLKDYPTDSTACDAAAIANEIALGNKILPSFAPGSGPFQGQQGSIVGQPNSMTALATLYLALCIHHELELLNADGDIIFGSMGSKNPVLLGLLAQLRPSQRVLTSDESTGTVMGTWLLTRWSAAHQYPVDFKQVAPLIIAGLEVYADNWC